MLLMHVPLTTLNMSRDFVTVFKQNLVGDQKRQPKTMNTGNNIRANGVRSLSEALKNNTTLDTLKLGCVHHHQ